MKAPTKRQLYERIESLEQQVLALQHQVAGIGDYIVPYTASETVEVGHTILIRVPRNFGNGLMNVDPDALEFLGPTQPLGVKIEHD